MAPDPTEAVLARVRAVLGGSGDASGAPAPVTVPTELARSRLRISRRAVFGLLLLLVLAAAVLGVRVWQASAAAAPQPAASTRAVPSGLVERTVPPAFATSGADAAGISGASGTAGAGAPVAGAAGAAGSLSGDPGASAGTAGAAGGAGGAAGVVVVHVVGAVASPGVVRLPGGARVIDAVTAAGGALPSADLSRVNLAEVLTDGSQIVLPKIGDPPSTAVGSAAAPAATGAHGGASSVGATAGLVNLNTADLGALDGLPGVGPVLAQRILDWRAAHGKFSSIDELGEVPGIGEKLLGQLRAKVRV